MTTSRSLTSTLLLSSLALTCGRARADVRTDGLRFLPDVPGQFRALTERPDPMGFRIGGAPDPSTCRHLQAMVRVDSPDGTPYFLVTRSGNTPFPPGGLLCDDSPGETYHGHLIVFRMDSRDRNGERLRSNRLSLDVLNETPPPLADVAATYFTVTENGLVPGDGSGGTPPRMFQHAGGMQLVGHTLALAIEHPCQDSILEGIVCEPTTVQTLIMFLDVTDPEHPVRTSQFSPDAQLGNQCGVVGVAPLADGTHLLVTAGGDGDDFFFYRSNAVALSSPALTWSFFASTPGPEVEDPHQTLAFLREGDIDGALFLAGARGKILFDNDRIDLYRVGLGPDECVGGEPVCLTVERDSQRISPVPPTFGDRQANLAAASDFYVSPSGEFIFYATEHDNDGPQRSVKAGEWRHRDVVRDESPTLLPNAALDDAYDVDEGGTGVLTGAAEPPLTRAFIQIFAEHDFEDYCAIIDYDDHDLDEFDDLDRLCLFDQDSGLRSWSWYAPLGCAISMTHSRTNARKTLRGTGFIEHDPDLSVVLDDSGTRDMELNADMADFDTDCDAYYEAPMSLVWDLDGDGVPETTGLEVTLDAAGLDGPALLSLAVEARHPDGGRPGTAEAVVRVRNVAPAVGTLDLTDGAGNGVPSPVPFVLVGLPFTLHADFRDPGIPDRQTAVLAWGDGTDDTDSAFTTFTDAFGTGVGEAVATHAYAAPGTYSILFTVTDDDGGVGDDTVQVEVLTAAEAAAAAADLLGGLIAGTTDPRVLQQLAAAAKALSGNPGAMNGARNMIEKENVQAAIAFLNVAIRRLQLAGTEGADVAMLTVILNQIIAALAAGA